MEYVRGQRIDEHAQTRGLDARARIRLLLAACRVLGDEHSATPYLATPRYAAPEQLCGETATTAADVYSLALLGRELVPEGATDLAAVLHAATHADPGLRTASASALACELERWLAHRPVEARSASFAHRQRAPKQSDCSARAMPIELVPPIHWLEIAFEPTMSVGVVVCSSVSLDVECSRAGGLPPMLRSGSGSNRRQQGSWPFRHGTSRVRWLVAAGNLKVQAMQTFEVLLPGTNGHRSESVDTVDVDIADLVHSVTLRIPSPPADAELDRPARK